MSAMAEPGGDVWMLCSACRKGISFAAIHWVCSVSTCNRSRTRLVFCSVACWDSHLSTLRHREAWAVEETAPNRDEHARRQAEEVRVTAAALASSVPPPSAPPSQPQPPRTAPPVQPAPVSSGLATAAAFAGGSGSATAHAGGAALSSSYDHQDVLVVMSKVKKYIRDRSGMNTSDAVAEGLGDHVRQACDEAIRNAARDGRKTVLDRDVPKVRR
jgi:hypothetical protein